MGYKRPHVNYEKKKAGRCNWKQKQWNLCFNSPYGQWKDLNETRSVQDNARTKNINLGKKKKKKSHSLPTARYHPEPEISSQWIAGRALRVPCDGWTLELLDEDQECWRAQFLKWERSKLFSLIMRTFLWWQKVNIIKGFSWTSTSDKTENPTSVLGFSYWANKNKEFAAKC